MVEIGTIILGCKGAKIVNKIYSGWQISLTDDFDIGGSRSVLH